MPENETPVYETVLEGEIVTETFLPLTARRVLYVLSLAAAVVAPVLAVTAPEYAAAIVTASGVLAAAAGATALANPRR